MLQPRGAKHASTTGFRTGGLAPELLSQSADRLRILALLYAFTFFMAGGTERVASCETAIDLKAEPFASVLKATASK